MSRIAEKRPASPIEELDVGTFYIPDGRRSWQTLAENFGLQGLTIHDIDSADLGSGSDVNQEQFCLLRAIWPSMIPPEEFEGDEHIHGLGESLRKAACIVMSSTEMRRYLAVVGYDIPIQTLTESSANWPGSFKPTRAIQEQTKTIGGVSDRERPAMRTTQRPKRTRQSKRETVRNFFGLAKPAQETSVAVWDLPGAEDEMAPNAAVILFLQSLSGLVPAADVDWVLNRLHFSPSFRQGSYNAYTDGALRVRGSGALMGIIEAKKLYRFDNTIFPSVMMQETAEVVGWLLREPDQRPAFMNNRRLVISQDRDELFVTFACFGQDYIEYLTNRNGPVTDNAFLTMQTYGPFKTSDYGAMQLFAQIMVAITLSLCETGVASEELARRRSI